MNLGARLAAIAAFIPPGSRVADIGTDHGYLPAFLIERGDIAYAVAGDVNQGPLSSASELVARLGMGDKIAVRLGDGLAVVAPGEVDTVVIAGMGSSTIINILQAQPEVVVSLKRLVLQPMVGAAKLRRWLMENGWRVVDETLVEDEGRLYEIIAAEQGESPEVESILYEIGPVLWSEKPPLLAVHIENLIMQGKRILKEMEASAGARSSAPYAEYAEKVRQLEVKLKCLLNAK